MSSDIDASLEAELERLRSMPIVELRALWRAKFKSDPPKAFGPDLLRRSIAYRIQEKAYGGLDRATARLLNQLIAQHTRTPGKIVLPRRIKPGAILVRQWKKDTHRVTVLENGFAYQGSNYDTLASIAKSSDKRRFCFCGIAVGALSCGTGRSARAIDQPLVSISSVPEIVAFRIFGNQETRRISVTGG